MKKLFPLTFAFCFLTTTLASAQISEPIQEISQNSSESSDLLIEETEQNLESISDEQTESEQIAENSEESEIGGEILAEPQPSRSIEVLKNQYLDIEYPGSGWIYMGEQSGESKLTFYRRRLPSKSNQNTLFTLTTQEEGTTLLHFYKNDQLKGSYIDDYLEVLISEKEDLNKNHVKAPEYKNYLAITAKEIIEGKNSSENPTSTENLQNDSTVESEQNVQNQEEIQQTPETSTFSTSNPTSNIKKSEISDIFTVEPPAKEQSDSQEKIQELLDKAQTEYDSGKFENALVLVAQFFEQSEMYLDKALFLQAQILEAKSSVQNIKNAIDTYEVIVKNYRRSPLWRRAYERSRYLRRFYIDIR